MDTIAAGFSRAVDRVDAAMSRPTQDRLVGFSLAVPTATVLAIASHLTPDPAGFGTHRQLGLGACTFLTITGYPCPMCGMTTTFTLLAHWRPLDASLNQPFGVVLFTATVAICLIGLADLTLGRGLWRRAVDGLLRHETAAAGALIFGMVGGWAYKVALMRHLIAV